MSIVSELLLEHLPSKRKQTPSGWIGFNAVCCIHNGSTVDKRQRGGYLERGDIVSYHCFNCGYKASWQPGRPLSIKLKKLLNWLSVPDDIINRLALRVLQLNEGIEVRSDLLQLPKFNTVSLPTDSVLINTYTGEITPHLERVLNYMSKRSLYLEDGDFYWSPSLAFRDRLIIPFKINNEIVGWSARHTGDATPKYLSDQQPGFVFNMDRQTEQKTFVVVTEGPMDALPISGVALLGREINDQQAMLINRLNKQTILVPDRDADGKKLIPAALELGWSVSMPDWDDDIKDCSDAVRRYGRIYTLYSIVAGAHSSMLKVKLKEKKWFKK